MTAPRPAFSPVACLLLAGSAIYALWMTGQGLLTPGWETIAVLLALGILLSWHALKAIPPRKAIARDDTYLAWGLLILFAFVCLIPARISSDGRFALALWLFLLAPTCYLLGRHAALLLSAPLAVFAILIPIQDTLFLMLSHPLRLIATMLSVEFLQLFGTDVAYNLTTITLPDANFGITDACSGIQQVEALLLIGYLLVRRQQEGLWWGILHYAFIAPVVILANAIRLTAVVLLYKSMGHRVLEHAWHTALGYAQVILAIVFLWLFGLAIAWLHNAITDATPPPKGDATP